MERGETYLDLDKPFDSEWPDDPVRYTASSWSGSESARRPEPHRPPSVDSELAESTIWRDRSKERPAVAVIPIDAYQPPPAIAFRGTQFLVPEGTCVYIRRIGRDHSIPYRVKADCLFSPKQGGRLTGDADAYEFTSGAWVIHIPSERVKIVTKT